MDNNNSIFVQAKIEYTHQLVDTLKPSLYDGIKSIYDDAKDLYKSNSSTSLLFIFRTLLEKIPEWNNELIVNETDRIIECSKCDWLDELVTAVYISHTKILMSIGNSNSNKINLTIPKLINFVHKCYINIAREIWKNPLLFSEDLSGYEYQKNMNVIESIICNCIENTIRISLPVKEILKEHLDINDNKSNGASNESKLLNELKELLLNSKKQDLIENNTDDKDTDDKDTDDKDTDDKDTDDKDTDDKDTDDTKIDAEDRDIGEVEVEAGGKDTDEKTANTKGDTTPKINLEPKNVFINDSDYESPDEEAINEKVENIEINDIPDISNTENVVEPVVYDNPNIIDNPQKENDELYQKLIKINENNMNLPDSDNPIRVEKVQNPINKEIIKDKNEDILKEPDILSDPISIEDELKKQQNVRGYDKIQDITKEEIKSSKDTVEQIVVDPKKEGKHNKKDLTYIEDIIANDNQKKEQKEIVSVDKRDDDTETIDLFYNDLKEISDKKGLTMEAVDEDKYTLFDDL